MKNYQSDYDIKYLKNRNIVERGDISEALYRIIDRKSFEEHIPRKNILLAKNNIFIELTEHEVIRIYWLLKKVLGESRYNTFIQISRLAKEKKKTNEDLLDIFNRIEFGHYNKTIGTDCYGLSDILKKELEKRKIYSYFIRFDSGGTLNDNYLINGHTALCIPRNIGGDKAFTLLNPGMFISKPITFLDGKGTTEEDIHGLRISVEKKEKNDLPYMLKINDKELFFDPYYKWENPEETLSKDRLSSIGNFKIVKQTADGIPLYYMRVNIKDNLITFKIRYSDIVKKIDISFSEFINLEKNIETLTLVKELSFLLGEKHFGEFYNQIKDVISISEEYRDKIWVSSTKKSLHY